MANTIVENMEREKGAGNLELGNVGSANTTKEQHSQQGQPNTTQQATQGSFSQSATPGFEDIQSTEPSAPIGANKPITF